MLHCGEVKKEKTLTMGEISVLSYAHVSCAVRKGGSSLEYLNAMAPNWKMVSMFEYHIPECGQRPSVCVLVFINRYL